MRRRAFAVFGCGVGLAGGIGLTLLCGAGEKAPDSGRFQLHAWGTSSSDHGADRIGTQTGEVYLISGTQTYKLTFN